MQHSLSPIPQKARNGWGTAFQNFWSRSKILAETASVSCVTVLSGGSREADFDSFSEPESCQLSALFREFSDIFGHFSGNFPPFSAKNRVFPEGHFLHCGILCAFSRTLRIFPESAFCSARTRGFFTFRPHFSFQQRINLHGLKNIVGGEWGVPFW